MSSIGDTQFIYMCKQERTRIPFTPQGLLKGPVVVHHSSLAYLKSLNGVLGHTFFVFVPLIRVKQIWLIS